MPKITGVGDASNRIRKLIGPEMVTKVGQALFAGGQIIEIEAAQSITRNSTNAKGQHIRSLPGEAPNAETGLLDRSIETVLVAPLHVEVSANAPYAAALEYGTTKMAPRPYMAPALQRKRQEVVDLVRGAVKFIVSRGGNGN